jgi:hypothetical protein
VKELRWGGGCHRRVGRFPRSSALRQGEAAACQRAPTSVLGALIIKRARGARQGCRESLAQGGRGSREAPKSENLLLGSLIPEDCAGGLSCSFVDHVQLFFHFHMPLSLFAIGLAAKTSVHDHRRRRWGSKSLQSLTAETVLLVAYGACRRCTGAWRPAEGEFRDVLSRSVNALSDSAPLSLIRAP